MRLREAGKVLGLATVVAGVLVGCAYALGAALNVILPRIH